MVEKNSISALRFNFTFLVSNGYRRKEYHLPTYIIPCALVYVYFRNNVSLVIVFLSSISKPLVIARRNDAAPRSRSEANPVYMQSGNVCRQASPLTYEIASSFLLARTNGFYVWFLKK